MQVFLETFSVWICMMKCKVCVSGRPDTVCVCVMGTAGSGNEYRGRGDGCEWSSCDRWANRCSPQPSERRYLWAGKDSQTQKHTPPPASSVLKHITYICTTLLNNERHGRTAFRRHRGFSLQEATLLNSQVEAFSWLYIHKVLMHLAAKITIKHFLWCT